MPEPCISANCMSLEAFRGQGAGSWAIDQVFAMACKERRPALRLTVFENNPAQALYERKGLKVVGKDECFLRMQRDINDLASLKHASGKPLKMN